MDVLEQRAVALAAHLDEAGVRALERSGLLTVPVEEDRQRRRLAQRAEVVLAAAPDEHRLRPGQLRGPRLLRRLECCDERDSVPLGDRLAEAASAVHRPRW